MCRYLSSAQCPPCAQGLCRFVGSKTHDYFTHTPPQMHCCQASLLDQHLSHKYNQTISSACLAHHSLENPCPKIPHPNANQCFYRMKLKQRNFKSLFSTGKIFKYIFCNLKCRYVLWIKLLVHSNIYCPAVTSAHSKHFEMSTFILRLNTHKAVSCSSSALTKKHPSRSFRAAAEDA